MVCMDLSTGPIQLANREVVEHFDAEVRLLIADMMVSHRPDAYDLTGVKLRDLHRDVYAKLRGAMICAAPDCSNMDAPDPNGDFHCRKHIVASLVPKVPPAAVSFADDVSKKEKGRRPRGLS